MRQTLQQGCWGHSHGYNPALALQQLIIWQGDTRVHKPLCFAFPTEPTVPSVLEGHSETAALRRVIHRQLNKGQSIHRSFLYPGASPELTSATSGPLTFRRKICFTHIFIFKKSLKIMEKKNGLRASYLTPSAPSSPKPVPRP